MIEEHQEELAVAAASHPAAVSLEEVVGGGQGEP